MNYLEHSGVKGMKWGIRKLRLSRTKKTPDHWDRRYKNRSSMSNADLKRYTERLRLENKFAEQIKLKNQKIQKKGTIKKFNETASNINSSISNVAKIAGAVSAAAGATTIGYRNKDKVFKVADVAFKAVRKAK